MSERLNIKNMLVEPEKRSDQPLFDPDRDISAQERLEIANSCEYWQNLKAWPEFAAIAVLELQLGAKVTISPEERQAMAAGRQGWQQFQAPLFSSLAILEIQLGGHVTLTPEVRQQFIAHREDYRHIKSWFHFAPLASLELQLGGQVPVSSEERHAIAIKREKYRQEKEWRSFAPLATFELLLDPPRQSNDPTTKHTPSLPETRKF